MRRAPCRPDVSARGDSAKSLRRTARPVATSDASGTETVTGCREVRFTSGGDQRWGVSTHGYGQQGNTNRAPSGPREDGSTASARYRIPAGLPAWLDVSVCRAQSEDSEMMSRVPSTGCKSVARWCRFAIEGQQPGYRPAGSRSSAGLGYDGRSDKRAERLTLKLPSRCQIRQTSLCKVEIAGSRSSAS